VHTLNKQLQTANKGDHPAWWLGVEVATSHHKKKKNVVQIHTEPQTWMNSLNKQPE
jgi:hypothetical protein